VISTISTQEELMNVRTAPVAVSLALALALAAGACGTSISDEVARDRQIDKGMAAVVASGVPGATLVVRDGGSTNRVAFGVGEVTTKTPLKVDDRFRVGSLAKTYVSVIVLQLVDEKKVGLDDTIEKFVPGMVPNGAKVTIRQLLNHTSGIPNYEEHPEYMAPYMAGDLGHVTTPAQLVAMGTSFGSWFAPGTSSRYSNTNYTLAGLIIEKVTGSTLGDQFDQRIFKPLKLDSTSLPATPEITGPHAHGYFVMGPDGATDVTNFSPSIAWAGGGIVSTTSDVTAFYRALLEGKLLPPELMKQMMTTVVDDKVGTVYGLGIEKKELSCGSTWGHQGNFPGYMMESFSSVDAKKQFTGAYNLDPNSMEQASAEAVNKLRDDAFCG
jgi:D-alanyl-D-alanine carboxypeptidase